MRNITHAQALDYNESQPAANTAVDVFSSSKRTQSLGTPHDASGRGQLPKNEVDRNGAAVLGGLGSDAAKSERSCALAILRAAYSVARDECQRIQIDQDLLVGIARAVEAYIYDPAYALERAVEHGLVAWPEIEVAS